MTLQTTNSKKDYSSQTALENFDLDRSDTLSVVNHQGRLLAKAKGGKSKRKSTKKRGKDSDEEEEEDEEEEATMEDSAAITSANV